MKSWFILKSDLPKLKIKDNTDVRFPIELPKKFVQAYTQKGDTVLDVFAGFGTTLFAAQELGRIGIGIEYEKKRASYVSKQLRSPSKIIWGDARKLNTYDLPAIDLCFTSPPYMRSFDEENPLTNYHERGGYKPYLKQLKGIFQHVQSVMKPDARVIVEVENTYEEGEPVTPLAWDIGNLLSELFFFEKDFVCCAEREGTFKTDHSYVLVFMNKIKRFD